MSTQTELTKNAILHEHREHLPHAIHALLSESGGEWEGTLTELAEALELGIIKYPRALAVRLKKCSAELENLGIFVKTKKVRGKYIKILAFAPIPSRAVTNHSDIGQSKGVVGGSKIKYPFSWRYGRIEKLCEEKKAKFAKPIENGKKRHYRHCQLCGLPKSIEYRKICDGNSSLLCESCANNYCLSAIKLQQSKKGYILNGEGERDLSPPTSSPLYHKSKAKVNECKVKRQITENV